MLCIMNIVLVLLVILVTKNSAQKNLIKHVPFATLAETLARYKEEACDGDIITLACPDSTKVYNKKLS